VLATCVLGCVVSATDKGLLIMSVTKNWGWSSQALSAITKVRDVLVNQNVRNTVARV
jgi:hypothetical protein